MGDVDDGRRGPAGSGEQPVPEILRAVFERAPEAIGVLDALGRPRLVNPAAANLLGYQGAARFPGDLRSFVHPDDYAAAAAQFGALLGRTCPGSGRLRFRMLASDGSWRWLEMLVVDLRDLDEIGGFLTITRDVTTDHDRTEQVERLEAARAQLLAAVSRELRTPLTSIVSAVEHLLAVGDPDPGELTTYLRLLSRNAARLMDLVDDLADREGLEADGAQPAAEWDESNRGAASGVPPGEPPGGGSIRA